MAALYSLSLAIAALGGAPSPAEAATPVALDLEWRGPAGCPGVEHVERSIARLTGRPVQRVSGSRTRVRARVRTRDDRFVVDLVAQAEGAVDRRTIDATRCSALADATALIIAVALRPMAAAAALPVPPAEGEPEVVPIQTPTKTTKPANPTSPVVPIQTPKTDTDATSEPEPEPEPEPETTADESASAPAPRVADEPAPEATSGEGLAEPGARRRRPLRMAIGATIGPGIGVLPGIAAELRGSVAVLGRRWRLGLTAMHWFNRTTTTSLGQIGVETSMTGGGLRGCFVPGPRPLEIPVCAGAELGSMRGHGRGLDVLPRRSRSPHLSTHVGTGLAWAPSPLFALTATADLIAALIRPGFHLDVGGIQTELYRAPALGGRVSLGIEIRLP